MNEEPNPPNNVGNGMHPLLWLLVAFIPSIVALGCLGSKTVGSALVPVLLILDVGCSLAAGFGFVSGMKSLAGKVALGLFLGVFFVLLNAAIVLFLGCSGMGRIAP